MYFYHLNTSSTITQDNFPPYIFVLTSILVALYLWPRSNFLLSILLLSCDVEMNQGSKLISKESFSIFHWNLNSTNADNYTKIPLLKAYIAVFIFDIIYLSENYLECLTTPDDENLDISGCNLVCSDYISNNKRGVVCIYYKA